MNCDKRTVSYLKVIKPNYIESKPGGLYELGLDNDTEERVIRLHMLAHFIDLMIEDICDTSENRVIRGARTEQLAEDLFDQYKPFIEAGIDIFEYNNYYVLDQLNKYKARPVVGGQLNAGPDEDTEGLPAGWWCNFPGYAHKYFSFGKLTIDEDKHIRIGLYDAADDENTDCKAWIEIARRGDYSVVCKHYPDQAAEIITACEFIYNLNHI